MTDDSQVSGTQGEEECDSSIMSRARGLYRAELAKGGILSKGNNFNTELGELWFALAPEERTSFITRARNGEKPRKEKKVIQVAGQQLLTEFAQPAISAVVSGEVPETQPASEAEIAEKMRQDKWWQERKDVLISRPIGEIKTEEEVPHDAEIPWPCHTPTEIPELSEEEADEGKPVVEDEGDTSNTKVEQEAGGHAKRGRSRTRSPKSRSRKRSCRKKYVTSRSSSTSRSKTTSSRDSSSDSRSFRVGRRRGLAKKRNRRTRRLSYSSDRSDSESEETHKTEKGKSEKFGVGRGAECSGAALQADAGMSGQTSGDRGSPGMAFTGLQMMPGMYNPAHFPWLYQQHVQQGRLMAAGQSSGMYDTEAAMPEKSSGKGLGKVGQQESSLADMDFADEGLDSDSKEYHSKYRLKLKPLRNGRKMGEPEVLARARNFPSPPNQLPKSKKQLKRLGNKKDPIGFQIKMVGMRAYVNVYTKSGVVHISGKAADAALEKVAQWTVPNTGPPRKRRGRKNRGEQSQMEVEDAANDLIGALGRPQDWFA